MDKPEISEKFTIEDIHKIREYNAERRRKLTIEERLEDIKKVQMNVKKKNKSCVGNSYFLITDNYFRDC